MLEILKDTSWMKAHNLILDKYGKHMSYRAMRLMGSEAETFYCQGDDLIVPLKQKSCELGEVIVQRGSLLPLEQKMEVVDLIKFLIEPKIYNLHLKYTEENAAFLKKSNTDSDLKRRRVIDLFQVNKPQKQTLSQVIHLKSHHERTRHKVAFKIHEMAEKNLFVHLDDIAATLTSIDDIKTLNDTTIYVENVEDLSNSMIELLTQYLDLSLTSGPLFLIGSSLPMEEVENKNWPSALKKDLMGFYFDIDRVPISQQTSSEILDLLFFQVDNMMS